MPEICRFLGIIIAIFYDDHNPPHFHARYGEHKAVIKLDDLTILEGVLPPRVLGLVIEWASLHKEELANDWNMARDGKPLLPIKPLE
ncbi:MAG: DUF4160 domain-containing protein [Planctomycetota bacterium]